jgi:hypothetical protein
LRPSWQLCRWRIICNLPLPYRFQRQPWPATVLEIQRKQVKYDDKSYNTLNAPNFPSHGKFPYFFGRSVAPSCEFSHKKE